MGVEGHRRLRPSRCRSRRANRSRRFISFGATRTFSRFLPPVRRSSGDSAVRASGANASIPLMLYYVVRAERDRAHRGDGGGARRAVLVQHRLRIDAGVRLGVHRPGRRHLRCRAWRARTAASASRSSPPPVCWPPSRISSVPICCCCPRSSPWLYVLVRAPHIATRPSRRGVFVAVFLLGSAPWVIRNYRWTGLFIPANTHGGVQLWFGTLQTGEYRGSWLYNPRAAFEFPPIEYTSIDELPLIVSPGTVRFCSPRSPSANRPRVLDQPRPHAPARQRDAGLGGGQSL